MTARTDTPPLLDPIAFVAALVLAPLAFAILTFWILLIPVFAIFLGGIPYLVFGTPVLLWMVTRYPPQIGLYALGGLAAHAAFVLCLALWQSVEGRGAESDMLPFLAGWGIPFALGWGGMFASLYRTFYRNPLP